MIIGVGIDLIEVARVQRALEHPKTGPRFRSRVYTGREIEYCEARRRKYESYAGRFAAKEAVMKALGTGWSGRVSWLDIEVVPAPGGKPEIHLNNPASALAEAQGIRHFFLSITHTREHAMASVVAEGESEKG